MKPMKELSVYVAGPLTHLKNPEIKNLYVQIGALCRELGMHATVPHVDIEQSHDLVTPQFIYHADSRAVRDADVMIAYVGETSLGVGIEIEVANQNNTLFITFAEKETRVSRMVLGSPNLIKHVEFERVADVVNSLRPLLEKLQKSLK